MKNGKRSGIPLKVQVTLAVVLGIVLIALSINTVGKVRKARAHNKAAPPVTGVAVSVESEGETSVKADPRIDSLIAELDRLDRENRNGGVSCPELAGDPFLVPDLAARQGRYGASGQVASAFNEGKSPTAQRARKTREQFVESLTLEATLRDGNARFALINGTVYAEKEVIGEFTIVEIRERKALLADDRGTVSLEMEEV